MDIGDWRLRNEKRNEAIREMQRVMDEIIAKSQKNKMKNGMLDPYQFKVPLEEASSMTEKAGHHFPFNQKGSLTKGEDDINGEKATDQTTKTNEGRLAKIEDRFAKIKETQDVILAMLQQLVQQRAGQTNAKEDKSAPLLPTPNSHHVGAANPRASTISSGNSGDELFEINELLDSKEMIDLGEFVDNDFEAEGGLIDQSLNVTESQNVWVQHEFEPSSNQNSVEGDAYIPVVATHPTLIGSVMMKIDGGIDVSINDIKGVINVNSGNEKPNSGSVQNGGTMLHLIDLILLHISSKIKFKEASMLVDVKKHGFVVEIAMDELLMLTFDPGGWRNCRLNGSYGFNNKELFDNFCWKKEINNMGCDWCPTWDAKGATFHVLLFTLMTLAIEMKALKLDTTMLYPCNLVSALRIWEQIVATRGIFSNSAIV